MKRTFLSLIFFIIYSCLLAQERPFVINGRIEGEHNFKYAVLYNAKAQRIGKYEIKDGMFAFSGTYQLRQQKGEITIANIYLVVQDLPGNYGPLVKSNKVINRRIMLEPKINIVFNIRDNSSKVVKGGELNRINDIFIANHEYYLKKLDSTCSSIIKENYDSLATLKKTKEIKRTLYLEEMQKTLDLIKQYPSSEASLNNFIRFAVAPSFNDDRARVTFNHFSNQIKQSKYGKRIDSMLADLDSKMVKVNVIGNNMPLFELEDLNGKITKSKDLLGKYTLIDFWASWCAPCRQESPNLKRAFNQYHNFGLNVIAISIDQNKDRNKWMEAIENDGVQQFTHLFNPGGNSSIAKELKINAIPANYLLDANGKIIATDLRGDNLFKKLRELFNR